jgi:hypothetical protein
VTSTGVIIKYERLNVLGTPIKLQDSLSELIINNAILRNIFFVCLLGIALGYGLDDRGSRVRFPVGAGNFSLHHRVQTGSGTHPTSYPMGTRGSFPGGKAAGA